MHKKSCLQPKHWVMMSPKRREFAMSEWIRKFKDSSPLTKRALIALIIWAVPVVIMTVFCYARLDFVRSYVTPTHTEQSTSK